MNFQNVSLLHDHENLLLVNPQLHETEKALFHQLKSDFELHFDKENFVLLASSGSSAKSNESTKLLALSRHSILNSAERVNAFLGATAKDSWGLVLPVFHIAGLSILARAQLVGAKIYPEVWQAERFSEFLHQNQISYTSLVPTQIFDLIAVGAKAPPTIKSVFVGGGALRNDLREKILLLGWPIIESYGMTETCSMIATKDKDGDFFKSLPGVELDSIDSKLVVTCNSLLTASLQKMDGEIRIVKQPPDAGFLTADRVKLENHKFRFLGRDSEYLKILGIGVSISELRLNFERLILNRGLNYLNFEILALEDVRAGHFLVLFYEDQVSKSLAEQLVIEYNKESRPYERIHQICYMTKFPRSELGKLKVEKMREDLVANFLVSTRI